LSSVLSVGILSSVPRGLEVLCAGGEVMRADWERTTGTHAQSSTPELTLGTGCQSKESSGTFCPGCCLEKSALFVHVRSGATCVAVCALACASRCSFAFAVVVTASLPRSTLHDNRDIAAMHCVLRKKLTCMLTSLLRAAVVAPARSCATMASQLDKGDAN